MDVQITLGQAVLLAIGIAAVILLVYIIRAVRALLPSLKSLSTILEDTQKVTGLVAETTTSVEDSVRNLTGTADGMSQFVKENQSTVKAMVSLVNAIVAIRKLFN